MKNAHEFLRVLPLLSLACVGMWNCTVNPFANGGSGSTTTNGITASIFLPNGAPAIGAVVKLRPASFLAAVPQGIPKTAVSIRDTITDDKGRFLISAVDSGEYCIEINTGSMAVLLDCTLPGTGDTDTLKSDTVRNYATISGNLGIANTGSQKLYMRIYGMDRVVSLDSTGHFEADGIPPGTYRIKIAAAAGSSFVPVEVNGVTVGPGEKRWLPFVEWNHSAKVVLNTTVSGAGVFGMVTGFPVLIRLKSENFTFNQAQENGGDIRFTKSDGSTLPFEIERWDLHNEQAEIWVRVDTVFGDNNTQYLIMYWGNTLANTASAPSIVFDTAQGFQGVWHLAETEGKIIKDATYNQYDGIPYGTVSASVPGGVIGQGQKLDGISSYIAMPYTGNSRLDFPLYGHYSISAWVYADTVDSSYSIIASKGLYNYYLQLGDGNNWGFLDFQQGAGLEKVYSQATGKNWTYLHAVRSGIKQYLYVNGVCADSLITLFVSDSTRLTIDDFMIGKCPAATGSHPFQGMVDEVRVSNVAYNPDWVKLCYMNQKQGDLLAVFNGKN